MVADDETSEKITTINVPRLEELAPEQVEKFELDWEAAVAAHGPGYCSTPMECMVCMFKHYT